LKSMTLLWKVVTRECATRCCISATFNGCEKLFHREVERDIAVVERRIEREGISFLTISLSNFGKDFERSLDRGYVDRDLFQGFAFTGGLPRLFGGFLDLVFDRQCGRLLDDPSIDSIQCIRQISLMNAKIELDCTPKRVKSALRGYIQCEQELRVSDKSITSSMKRDFSRLSSMLYRELFLKLDRKIFAGELVPKHGPGATADKLTGNGKFYQSTWPKRLDRVFPSWDYLVPGPRFSEDLDRIEFLDPGMEIPAKVITVPKTLKTPRIIAIEPTAMQYAQQGVREAIYEEVEDDFLLRSFIGFMDQSPNQILAQKGSLTGNLATLDLSEASDRVSNQLVLELTREHRLSTEALQACRSRKADVPGFGVQRLAKFASMGSALCFPIEAMVFLTIVLLGIEENLNRPLSRRDLHDLVGKVRIFGDDIIVPVDTVRSVVGQLEAFGFRVNRSKSFWTGKFRESCGKEYYSGHDVSIVKVRQLLPTQRKDVSELEATVAFRNHMYFSGYWATARYLDELLERILRFYPVIHPTSPLLGRHSFLPYQAEKLDPHLHSPLVRGYVVKGRPPRDLLDGPGALLKWFLKRGDLPFADRDHLERSGRPQAVDIKLRYGSPY